LIMRDAAKRTLNLEFTRVVRVLSAAGRAAI
jgi:hypothetical protein